jgi:hypothetical protein
MGRMLLDTINGYTSYLNFVELALGHNGLASVPRIYKDCGNWYTQGGAGVHEICTAAEREP